MGNIGMLNLEVRRESSLKESVFSELKRRILSGEVPPGTRLLEVELSKQMNVSRTPVRDAIRRLEEDGLVHSGAGRGVYVSNMSVKEMLDVFEIREDMEGFCAYLAAQRADSGQKQRLKRIAEAYSNACDARAVMDLIRLDEEFHNCIVECCDNETLKEVVNYVQMMSLRFRFMFYADEDRYVETVAQHMDIMEAIAAGKADEARKLADCHVKRLKEYVFSLSN